MTTYRYKTTRILYDYVTSESNKTSLLNEAKLLINQATSVVRQREQKYRAPHLYDWGSNPTAYNFGYLWTVHSLYYFWRDYYQAIGHLKIKGHNVDVWSPCFLNIQDPIMSQFGRGKLVNMTSTIHKWLEKHHFLTFLADCMAHPALEPEFPLE